MSCLMNSYFLDADQEDTKNYFDEGLLNSDLVNNVRLLQSQVEIDQSKGIQRKFAAESQAKLYESVLSDLKKIQKMLDEIEGSPKSDCPNLEVEAAGKNDYTFKRQEYLGRHCIVIKNSKQRNIQWTLGVKYVGNFFDEQNDVIITGFYLISSPISVGLFTEALEATKHFFPSDQLPYWLLRRHTSEVINSLDIEPGPRHVIFSYLGWDKGELEDSDIRLKALKSNPEYIAPPGGLSNF